MLVGFTCRKGGSGVTTVTLSVAKILEKHKVKCCLVDLKNNGDYVTLTINKKIKPITPGLSYILDKVFNVEVTRVIKNE